MLHAMGRSLTSPATPLQRQFHGERDSEEAYEGRDDDDAHGGGFVAAVAAGDDHGNGGRIPVGYRLLLS